MFVSLPRGISEPLRRLPRYGEAPRPVPVLTDAILGADPRLVGPIVPGGRDAEVLSIIPLEAALSLRHDLRLGGHEAALEGVHLAAHIRVIPIISLRRRSHFRTPRTANAPLGLHDDELDAAVAAVAGAGRLARGREGGGAKLVLVDAGGQAAVVPGDVDLLRDEDGAPAVGEHRPEDGDGGHDGRQVHLERA